MTTLDDRREELSALLAARIRAEDTLLAIDAAIDQAETDLNAAEEAERLVVSTWTR